MVALLLTPSGPEKNAIETVETHGLVNRVVCERAARGGVSRCAGVVQLLGLCRTAPLIVS